MGVTSYSQSSHNASIAVRLATKRPPQRTTTPIIRKSEIKAHSSSNTDFTRDPNGAVDLFAWHLKVSSQPLYKSLQTARKILTTHDWKV
jgi:hypothetical protein